MLTRLLKRNYIVLRKLDDCWCPFTAQYARTRKAALDAALSGDFHPSGVYVAVPVRQWRPETR